MRLADPARSRFALETAVLHRVSETGAVKGPAICYAGVEVTPDGEVDVMVQEHLPDFALGDYAAVRSTYEAHAAVERAGETLAAIHAVMTERSWLPEPGCRGSHARLGEWFIDLLSPKVKAAPRSNSKSSVQLDRAFDLLAAHRPVFDAGERSSRDPEYARPIFRAATDVRGRPSSRRR